MTVLATLVLHPAPACSLLVTRPPPKDVGTSEPACSDSFVEGGLDTVVVPAGLYVGVLGFGQHERRKMWIAFGTATLFALSAAYGFTNATACRDLRRAHAAKRRSAAAAASPVQPNDNPPP